MRTKTMSTVHLAAAVVILLVVLAFRVRVGAKANANAVLQTTGMNTLASKVTEAGFSCKGYAVLTPEQFEQVTGKEIRMSALPAKQGVEVMASGIS